MTTYEGRIVLNVNGVHLDGIKRNGVWRFICSLYPEVALKYSGDAEPFDYVQHFLDIATRVQPGVEVPPRPASA